LHYYFALYLTATDHRPEALVAEITSVCHAGKHSVSIWPIDLLTYGRFGFSAASFREVGDGA